MFFVAKRYPNTQVNFYANIGSSFKPIVTKQAYPQLANSLTTFRQGKRISVNLRNLEYEDRHDQ